MENELSYLKQGLNIKGRLKDYSKIQQRIGKSSYVTTAVLRRGKKIGERNIPPEKNPRYKIDQPRHSGSEFELYVQDALQTKKTLEETGLTWEDFGEYLTHLRNVHERVRWSKEDEQFVEIANPACFDRKSSQEVLDEWKNTLGQDKWDA